MRSLLPFVFVCILLGSCRDKIICPAFQSTYILDDSVRMAYFSYVWKLDEATRTNYLAEKAAAKTSAVATIDSSSFLSDTATTAVGNANSGKDYYAHAETYVVPPRDVKKNKFGIAKKRMFWVKNYQLKTAPMENVLTPDEPELPEIVLEDTASIDVGEIVASDFGEEVVADSVASTEKDSTGAYVLPTLARVSTQKKEKEQIRFLYGYDPSDPYLNVEQQYYNKYFGEYLISHRPLPEEKEAEETVEEEKNDFWQFILSLFGVKEKDEESRDLVEKSDDLESETADTDTSGEDEAEEPEETEIPTETTDDGN